MPIVARLTRPTASAAVTVLPSATPLTNPFTSSMKPSASIENPNNFGSCPTRIVTARPFMYPIIVGFDRRSAMNPSLSTPPSTVIAPTRSASIDASSIARCGSPFAPSNGRSVAAIIGPSDESGPSTSMRDGPKIA